MGLFINVLFVIVIVALIFTWFHRSAIWGGATIGLIVGGIIGLFTGNIFEGIKNGVTIGGIIGIVSEVPALIRNRNK